jgi:hypothetical protein
MRCVAIAARTGVMNASRHSRHGANIVTHALFQ